MNNFQLNNTSVYLGGQCKWDIVLGNKDGQTYIQGFQLTPLSDNVAFNKRGTINQLNKEHSYTIKKYCNELKENFWSIEPCLNQSVTITDDDTQIPGKMDNSFLAGTRRSSCYQVYKKQFECLQPVWLEKLEDDKYLKFSFNLYATSPIDNSLTPLDSKSLELKHIDSTDETFEFHNKFVTYFYNWLKYLNINDGNNKVLNVDLQNNSTQIAGVSTLSGQKINQISCDYVCDNLLMYERPNVETDYILTTLFKNHNLITSQLFNFNFCFNIVDVVNPFFINQLNGKTTTMMCDVSVNNESLERRSLFTNYEFIEKTIYDPYLFVDYTSLSLDGSGRLVKTYDVQYIYDNKPITDANVLDYLRDYESENVKDLNKLSQHIIHWDYVDHNQDIFNLYRGYSGLNSYFGNWTIEPDPDPEINFTHCTIKLFELNRINCNDPVYTCSYPIANNGVLNWIKPTNILVITNNIRQQLLDKIKLTAQSEQCVIYNEGLWNIEKSNIGKNTISNSYQLDSLNLTFIKCNFTSDDVDIFDEWHPIYSDENLNLVIIKNPYMTTGGQNHYILISKDIGYFSVSQLLETVNGVNASDDDTDFLRFREYIRSLNQMIRDIDRDYNFYGFKTEIIIGLDELQKKRYYKSLNNVTYVYRRCGSLSPCLKTDDNNSINYQYCKNLWDNSIHKINKSEDFYNIEYKDYGKNMILSVMSNIQYDIIKETTDPDDLKKKIKEKLKQTYNLDDDSPLIDYIYNLYEITFIFEYISETDISKIHYKVNMILK